MDFKSHSIRDLVKLRRDLDDELRNRHQADRHSVEPELHSAAQEWGYVADELIFGITPPEEKKAMEPPVYEHPQNPQLSWGGEGEKPGWVRDWERQGGSLEALKVKSRH